MLSAFLLSWATDNTDTTDLHRFWFPFSHSYTLPLRVAPLGQREKVRTGTLRFPPYLLPPIQGRTRSLEDGLNVHLCLVRGAIPIATRGLAGEGSAFTFPFIICLHYP